MTEPRPLLAFGAPAVGAIPPVGNRPFPPRPSLPTSARQGQRLTPQFVALQDAIASRRVDLAQNSAEPDPELVVVFELVGSVEDFSRAVRGVPGLEFLAELDEDDADPDDDFHYVDAGAATSKGVNETLYMIMSNAQAVTELISLFGRWQANPDEVFARGLNPLRRVFAQLRALRRWSPEDRIRETGLLEVWAEDVAVAGSLGSTRVEIELWFRSDSARQAQAQGQVAQLVADAGGQVISSAVIESVGYHAVLADLPYTQVEAVLSRGPGAIELLTTESVMFMSSVRPMTIPALEVTDGALTSGFPPAPTAPPRVALLDGLPLVGHTALAGRLLLDDPDSRALKYTADKAQHGTAMASLISHGDLSDPRPPLSTQIYVRPILEPHPFDGAAETIVRDELLVDLVHRAFHRMFDGDGQDPPAAPSVRIVNLSIGDPLRVFARRMSPLAKLLDWLAHRYNLVVLVSAGNHPITSTIPAEALAEADHLRRALAESAYSGARQRRLLSPAEAVNVLTVGALHADASAESPSDSVLDGLEPGMPALYNAVGFGYRRSVKPEILLPGGRSLHQRPPQVEGQLVSLVPARTAARGPGLRVASPGVGGALDATAFSYGTSNATALATRAVSHIMDQLEAAAPSPGSFPFPDAQYYPVLAKTLIVHAASWGSMGERLGELLGLERATARRDLTQILGYGAVDPNTIAAATRTRVLLIGAGSISADERHEYLLPLPASLASTTDWRRLTVTLGWLSPVNTRNQRHRMARLSFQPPMSELGVARSEADAYAVRKGTIQHELLEGRAAVAFTAGQALAIDVDCRVDAGRLEAPVRYGLAVSLELATTVNVDLHEEVRQGLQTQVRERVASQTRA